MIRSDRRTLIIGGVVLAVATGSAALALRFMGGNKQANPGLVKVVRRGNGDVSAEEPTAAPERSFDDYRAVTERNVFKPLVSLPQEHVALAVPADLPSATGAARTPPRSSSPPSPTADLAMTGVVESDAGLMALIKNIRTGASAYAGIGEAAFGLRVVSIEAKRITLAQGDETYTLDMGAKEIPEEGAESRSVGGTPSAGPPMAAAGAPGEGPMPGFGGRPGFGSRGMSREEMMRRMRERGMDGDGRGRGPRGGPGGRRGSGGGRGPGGGGRGS